MKTNKKTIQNHQSNTMLLFKMYTLEFEFDRHFKHFSEFDDFEIFMQNDCFAKPDFSYFSETSKINHT